MLTFIIRIYALICRILNDSCQLKQKTRANDRKQEIKIRLAYQRGACHRAKPGPVWSTKRAAVSLSARQAVLLVRVEERWAHCAALPLRSVKQHFLHVGLATESTGRPAASIASAL